MPISTVFKNTKIRSTMLCLSGFELYSLWVPLNNNNFSGSLRHSLRFFNNNSLATLQYYNRTV